MNHHHRLKQYAINAQYTIIRNYPTNEAQGELKVTNCTKFMGRLPGLSPLRSNVFLNSQAGRLERVSSGRRQLEGSHQTRVHSDQMILVMARQGGWTFI
jgi:hypothetical protein